VCCVAVCCRVLQRPCFQCVAVCCNVHCSARCSAYFSVCRHHHSAAHCNTVQHTAADKFTLTPERLLPRPFASTLQHAATRCNTLQHAANNSRTLQYTATCCNTLHAHCNTLQHTSRTLLHATTDNETLSLEGRCRAPWPQRATRCHTLQHAATDFTHTATRYNRQYNLVPEKSLSSTLASTLQHAARHCKT